MEFTLKIKKDGQPIRKCRTHFIRRFLKNLRTIKWQESHISVYLKVYYGKHEDNFGKIVPFYNDGEYENETDLWRAFNAFYEEGKNP
jgi:hypothetical protein